MKCHYEVLGISRDADDSEIRSAYKKLALKWHPDKNINNTDFAKEQFQLVQQAYEVLSDKQERAWYDSHREQILHGAKSEFKDNSLDVYQYFTTTCFKGYNDEEKGFYTVYRNVFHQIAKEDMEFMEDKEEFSEIPSFGDSKSEYEAVSNFYAYWMSYSTKKSYSWVDPYDIREGKGDRRLLKIIEKENKKARQKAKKERNEEVRNLVAFVRKRDKRLQEFTRQMEEKVLENRKKHQLLSQQKRLERKKIHEKEKTAEWAKFDNVKSELEAIEKHLAEEFGDNYSDSEAEEEDDNNLYCVACNKLFKTAKAFENHEQSKKHKENVEKVKQEVMEDEESILSDNMEDYNDIREDSDNIDETVGDCLISSDSDSIGNEEENGEILDSEMIVPDRNKQETKSKNKKHKRVKNPIPSLSSDEETKDIVTAVSDDDFDFSNSKKQRKKKTANKTKQSISNTITTEIGETTANVSKPKKEKKQKDEPTQSSIEVDLSHCCVTCKENFSSKNKLFAHLKKTNHGVYIPKEKLKEKKKAKTKDI